LLGVRLVPIFAKTEAEFEPAYPAFAERGAGAVLVAGDPFLSRRSLL
jgi:hypothetical protein